MFLFLLSLFIIKSMAWSFIWVQVRFAKSKIKLIKIVDLNYITFEVRLSRFTVGKEFFETLLNDYLINIIAVGLGWVKLG